MVTSNTYQIIDASGWRVAEITFHKAFSEALHNDYLEEICTVFSAAGYRAKKDPELSEFGKLIAD